MSRVKIGGVWGQVTVKHKSNMFQYWVVMSEILNSLSMGNLYRMKQTIPYCGFPAGFIFHECRET